jgi:hypothetical protein
MRQSEQVIRNRSVFAMSVRIHRSPMALAALALILGLAPTTATAQRYLQVSRVSQDIDAEFDDSILLSSSSFAVNIPALQEAKGLAFAFGGMEGSFGFALTHVRTDPRSTSVLGDTVAAHREYGVEFMSAPWLGASSLGVSPMFKFGAAWTTLKLPGQATDGTDLDDAKFSSISLIVGGGAMVRVAQRVHVTADYTRRFLKFRNVSAFGESLTIQDGLSATGDAISIGVGVYF